MATFLKVTWIKEKVFYRESGHLAYEDQNGLMQFVVSIEVRLYYSILKNYPYLYNETQHILLYRK